MMSKVPQPSVYILKKAWQLGQKMAQSERRIHPDTIDAHQYVTYELFRVVHRHRIEQLPAFLPWDERLGFLTDREANGSALNLDNRRAWDQFFSLVAGPIRSAFWQGWEQSYQLQTLYTQAVERAKAKRTQQVVLRICKPPVRPVDDEHPDTTEERLWGLVARKLFEEMAESDNSDFWKLPSPESIVRQLSKS
jgi:hypothetical protein